jgi:hypothetical protein
MRADALRRAVLVLEFPLLLTVCLPTLAQLPLPLYISSFPCFCCIACRYLALKLSAPVVG